jgi:hypothetical protein
MFMVKVEKRTRAKRVVAYVIIAAWAVWPALSGCRAAKGPSTVKPPSAYRADVFSITAKINDYLSANTPEDTARRELQQTVGAMAHEYAMLAAEARPLQGKTGDDTYGEVAAQAEDGEIVAGNLAGDPARKPDATTSLTAAVDDWATYNDELASHGTAGVPFEPNRWWDTPPWRRILGTGG